MTDVSDLPDKTYIFDRTVMTDVSGRSDMTNVSFHIAMFIFFYKNVRKMWPR